MSTAAGAWTWKEFFKGECGFCRMINLVLLSYVLMRDESVVTRILDLLIGR